MDSIARLLGGRRITLTVLFGKKALAPLRYVALTLATLVLLTVSRPRVVVAQNPPIFCPLACLIYTHIRRARLLVDYHSIWSKKSVHGLLGKLLAYVEKFVAIKAEVNIVPHSVWAEEVSRMGVSSILTLIDYVEPRASTEVSGYIPQVGGQYRYLAMAVHGGHPHERLESEIAAVKTLGDVALLLTGPPSKISRRVKSASHGVKNVFYLGILPRADYESVKRSVHFALSISDEYETIPHAIHEFASLGKPVIAVWNMALHRLFDEAILYAENSKPAAVREAIVQLIGTPGTLRKYEEVLRRNYDELREIRKKQEFALAAQVSQFVL